MLLDLVALSAFVWIKLGSDPAIVLIAAGSIAAIFLLEGLFLRKARQPKTHSHS